MRKLKQIFCLLVCLVIVLGTVPAAHADDSFIDEITDYEITVDVNEDAT